MSEMKYITRGTQTSGLCVMMGRCSLDGQHGGPGAHPANVGSTFHFRYSTQDESSPERRIDEHNNSSLRSARYTRARRPVKLVYTEKVSNRAEALKRECQIKKLSKNDKKKLSGC